jgi:nickel-dependent lactate racemase
VKPGDKAPRETTVTLSYGRGEITARLGDGVRARVLAPPRSSAADPVALLGRALEHPVASAELVDLAHAKRRVVISIPDGTRPPVARLVLPAVVAVLTEAGVEPHNINIFVASGAHAVASDDDLRDLVGDGLPDGISVQQNYARRAPDFRLVGITRRGTPVMLNNLVLEADLNVVIGSVAFHYFAGMGGGRKLVMPGACHTQTIAANHRLTINADGSLNPQCASGALEGNPVHEDMLEGMAYVNNIFMINLILDGWARVAAVTSGHPTESHLEAVKQAKRLLEFPISERCDLAIAGAGGYPLDVNFIQAHKSIDHAAGAVRDGGVLVAAAECSAGIGSETFLPWFGAGDARAVSRRLLERYELNGQTALALMKKLERIRIVLVSSLERDAVETMGLGYAAGLEEAVADALASLGASPLTYVLPSAWGLLPLVEA